MVQNISTLGFLLVLQRIQARNFEMELRPLRRTPTAPFAPERVSISSSLRSSFDDLYYQNHDCDVYIYDDGHFDQAAFSPALDRAHSWHGN